MSALDQLPTRPLDRIARDGRSKLVTDGDTYAVAKWRDDAWIYAVAERGRALPLDFVPSHYCP